MEQALQEFSHVLAQAGLEPGNIIADGKIHRCPVSGRPHARDGAYLIHCDDYPSGWLQNFATGETQKWTQKRTQSLTPAEREARTKRIEAETARREAELARSQATARQRAVNILAELPQAPSTHPYLERKGVPAAPGVCLAPAGNLVLPILGANGKPVSLQFISPDGSKRFLKHGEIKGGFFSIKGDPGKPLYIAEGYATAATIHVATGATVLVAFNAGNLTPVAELARKHYPTRPITICADYDHETFARLGKNPGVEAATAAAISINASLAIPSFADPKGKNDFNDLAKAEGLAQVAACIARATVPDKSKKNTASRPAKGATAMADSKDTPEMILDQLIGSMRNTPWFRKKFNDLFNFDSKGTPAADKNADETARQYAALQIKTVAETFNTKDIDATSLKQKQDMIEAFPEIIKEMQEKGFIEPNATNTFNLTDQGQSLLLQVQSMEKPQTTPSPDDLSKDYRVYPLNNGNLFHHHVTGGHAFETDKTGKPHLLKLASDPKTKLLDWHVDKAKPFGPGILTAAAAMAEVQKMIDAKTKKHEWTVTKGQDGTKSFEHAAGVYLIKQTPDHGICTLLTKQNFKDEQTGQMKKDWGPAQNQFKEEYAVDINRAMVDVLQRQALLDQRPIREGEILKGTVDCEMEMRGKKYIQIKIAPEDNHGKAANRYVPNDPSTAFHKGQTITAKFSNGEISFAGLGATLKQSMAQTQAITSPQVPTQTPSATPAPLAKSAPKGPSMSKGM